MNTITYEPLAGTHLDRAIREAHSLLKPSAKGQRAQVNFNGVNLLIGINDTPERIARLYDNICTHRSQRYRESEAGKAFAREQSERLTKMQDSLTTCIKMLPGLLNLKDEGLPNGRTSLVMGWLNGFIECSDHIELDWDKAADCKGGKEWVAILLESAGFREGELCGLPKDEYEKPETLGRWVIGQVINCLRTGMPPHPIGRKFIQEYFNLRRLEAKQ